MFEHSFPFDPTYGYTRERLLEVPAPEVPAGFAEFWRETYGQVMATPPRPTIREIASGRPGLEVFELEYDGIEGFRVGGWLTRPRNGKVKRGVVMGHGYGGRDAPDLHVPGEDAVAAFPCARGFHRSARPDLPADAGKHVVLGIESPRSYIHRHCVADLWSAVSALVELVPETAGYVDYLGTSFGGGIGAMALPWDPRIGRGFLGVPSFGHHDLRLKMQCVGSGEAVRQRYTQDPAIRQTLYYFDSAVSAQFCRIPVMVHCALFDPAVPPPGQFAVYNSLAGEKRLFVGEADHYEWKGAERQGARLYREQCEWFTTTRAAGPGASRG